MSEKQKILVPIKKKITLSFTYHASSTVEAISNLLRERIGNLLKIDNYIGILQGVRHWCRSQWRGIYLLEVVLQTKYAEVEEKLLEKVLNYSGEDPFGEDSICVVPLDQRVHKRWKAH